MKIRILYEENIVNGHKFYTYLDVPDGDYSVTLDIDYQMRLAEAKPEERDKVKRCNTLQEMYDIMNKAEYNNWRKAHRHLGEYIGQDCDDDGTGDGEEGGGWREPLMKEVANPDIFRRDEIERERKESYDDTCQRVREICGKKQNWADAFIAIRLDGMSVNDYAAKIGVSDASIVSKYLARAEKKIKENYSKRQK